MWAARLKGTRGFSRTVAIKTMLPVLSDDPLFEQMFLDEAQLAAQIHHPNVVEILDLGEDNDVLYLVMEYIDGEPLATILRTLGKRRERMPIPQAVRVIADACSALHAAHELRNMDGDLLGLVHRDVSPQNILISFEGVIKLVDFGVAKAAGRTASDTSVGQIKGKAPYMSPEQAAGKSVDRRTDVFALGIVLYQVTTGKHPFRGDSDVATLHNILHRTIPSPRLVDPEYPRPLEAVLIKALARNPDKRFQTAAEMAEALDRVFPPNARRVGPSDVAAFLAKLLGDVRTLRQDALREAIRRADARVQSNAGGSEGSGTQFTPLAELGSGSLSSPPGGFDLQRPVTPRPELASTPEYNDRISSSIPLPASSNGNVTAHMSRAAYPSLPPDLAPTIAERPPRPSDAVPDAASIDTPTRPKRRASTKGVIISSVALIALGLVTLGAIRSNARHAASSIRVSSSDMLTNVGGAAPASWVADAGVELLSEAARPTRDVSQQDARKNIADPGAAADAGTAVAAASSSQDASKRQQHGSAMPTARQVATSSSAWQPPPVADPGF